MGIDLLEGGVQSGLGQEELVGVAVVEKRLK